MTDPLPDPDSDLARGSGSGFGSGYGNDTGFAEAATGAEPDPADSADGSTEESDGAS